MQFVFELKNVRYEDVVRINHLTVPANKITCIIGESGSGKTTFLKLLNHLISPTEGTILYRGKNIRELDPVKLRREVVMLPQVPVTFPGTVKDNLEIALSFSEKEKMKDDEYKAVLELVNLKKTLNEEADKLSGGEKQRLALARVLLLDPKVLLLDEPSSALDEGTEHHVIRSVVEYSKKNEKTLIMVTHSKKIAGDFGDNLLKFTNGKIIL